MSKGPVMFLCTKFRCTLSQEACVRRQNLVEERNSKNSPRREGANDRLASTKYCREGDKDGRCKQGMVVAKAVKARAK